MLSTVDLLPPGMSDVEFAPFSDRGIIEASWSYAPDSAVHFIGGIWWLVGKLMNLTFVARDVQLLAAKQPTSERVCT